MLGLLGYGIAYAAGTLKGAEILRDIENPKGEQPETKTLRLYKSLTPHRVT